MTGDLPPEIRTSLPGPQSRSLVDVLAQHECPAITARRARRATALGTADDDPIVWREARGANVIDVDGNRLVDLTSGFGVALAGHRHPTIVQAVEVQAQRLVHAMGDAWPDQTRIRLLARLAEVCPDGLEVAILGLSGSDAVDAAIKTAAIATGRTGVLAFQGGYHGLALGVLGVQGYKAGFTDPFRSITHPEVHHLPWGAPAAELLRVLKTGDIGLVIAEPIQGRGGVRPPPDGWLAELAHIARSHGALVAFDEIQTGLGRTGSAFAGPTYGVIPDLMCLGKALGGGWPLSACVGTRQVMDRWGASAGEALHTQTFLGHPVGCAAALAALEVFASEDIPGRAHQLGKALRSQLEDRGYSVRGAGLMLGVELGDRSFPIARRLLQQGFLALPAGQRAEVLCLTPPVCLSDVQVSAFLDALDTAAEGTS